MLDVLLIIPTGTPPSGPESADAVLVRADEHVPLARSPSGMGQLLQRVSIVG